MKRNKILALCLVVAMCATMCAFVACNGNAEAATVMTVSLNPEVEFVLDGNGKVITVNALNEEGNLIISAQAFDKVEGKTAEEAAKLFVQVAKETGYLVSGRVSDGENEIEFSFSGDASDAQKLFEKVKTNVQNYLSKENVVATLQQAEAISREALEQLVAECQPYLDEAALKAMEYKQLVIALAESRKETAEMYSQELKNAYYQAKAFAMEQAKLEVVKSRLGTLQQVALDAANTLYVQANATLEQVRYDNLVAETSAYQKALAEVRAKKIEYLKFRNEVSQMEETSVTQAELARLDALTNALQSAENALVSAGENANAAIDSAKSAMQQAYNAIVSAVQSVNVDELANEISTKQTAAMESFFTEFETQYSAAETAAKDSWNAMEQALKQSEDK
ncbi:MAG: hypothetical protein ACI4QL_04720 [Candidatus Fimimonas sp.]